MVEPISADATDRYRVIEAIGSGGMGAVYLAHDIPLDRKVALKFIRADRFSAQLKQALSDEARTLASLNHPYIVQVFDICTLKGDPVLVMEYVDGMNLGAFEKLCKPTLSELIEIFLHVARALASAHETGVAHRDIKAENILVSNSGSVKLTDWGIANRNADLTQDCVALASLIERIIGERARLVPNLSRAVSCLRRSNTKLGSTAAEATRYLEELLHELKEGETPVSAIPVEPRQSGWQKLKYAFLMLGVAGLVALVFLAPKLSAPQQRSVAVAPTVLQSGSTQYARDHKILRSGIEQALSEAVLSSNNISLVSLIHESNSTLGIREIAKRLRVDELVLSYLNCNKFDCILTVERTDVPQFTVREKITLPLNTELTITAHDIVLSRISSIYNGKGARARVNQTISEEDYQRYLELHAQSHRGERDQRELLTEVEALLSKHFRYLPLYSLYANVALETHDEHGLPEYLHRLRQVLDNAEPWAGGAIDFRKARFELELESKNYPAASKELDKIVSLEADPVLINTLKGDLNRLQGHHAIADQHYQLALELQPSRRLFGKAASNLHRWKKTDEALLLYRRLLEVFPDDTSAIEIVALIEIERGNLDEGIALLKKALAITPYAIFRTDLGLAYLLKGQYVQAKAEFEKLYTRGRRDPVALLNLADTEALLGNTQRARELYERLVNPHTPENSNAELWIISQAHAQLGNFRQAIATLEKISTEDSESAFNAALVYTLAGQTVSALVKIEQALQEGFGAVWFNLPWFDVLCKEGQFISLMTAFGLHDRCQGAERHASAAQPATAFHSRHQDPPS